MKYTDMNIRKHGRYTVGITMWGVILETLGAGAVSNYNYYESRPHTNSLPQGSVVIISSNTLDGSTSGISSLQQIELTDGGVAKEDGAMTKIVGSFVTRTSDVTELLPGDIFLIPQVLALVPF